MLWRGSTPHVARLGHPSRFFHAGFGLERIAIAIAIGALQHLTMAVRNPLHGPGPSLDVERSGFADGNTAEMETGFLAFGQFCTHPITGLEAANALVPDQVATREAVLESARAAIGAAPGGLDRQHGAIPALDLIDSADAGSIERVGLGNVQARAPAFRPG